MSRYDQPPSSWGDNNKQQYSGSGDRDPRQANMPPQRPPQMPPQMPPQRPPQMPPPPQPPQQDNNLVKIMIIVAAAVVVIALMTVVAFVLLNKQKEEPAPAIAPSAAVTAATMQPATVATVKMPDLKGLAKEDAIGQLSKMNLKAEIMEVESDKQKDGFVFEQVPAKGATVSPGSAVTLYVAKAKATQPATKATQPPTTKATQPPTAAPTTQYLYCRASTYVALRTGKGVGYKELARIPSRGSMIYLGTDGDWYYVRYNGQEGYVYGEYVSFDPNAPLTYDGADYSSTLRCTADDFVSLRTGPDAGYSEIVKIPRGYTMTFLEESSNGWYHVRYGSYTGYVYSAYVEFI